MKVSKKLNTINDLVKTIATEGISTEDLLKAVDDINDVLSEYQKLIDENFDVSENEEGAEYSIKSDNTALETIESLKSEITKLGEDLKYTKQAYIDRFNGKDISLVDETLSRDQYISAVDKLFEERN